ncbi:hypothetical protein V6N13_038247 [Hibiscus sabdariffa]
MPYILHCKIASLYIALLRFSNNGQKLLTNKRSSFSVHCGTHRNFLHPDPPNRNLAPAPSLEENSKGSDNDESTLSLFPFFPPYEERKEKKRNVPFCSLLSAASLSFSFLFFSPEIYTAGVFFRHRFLETPFFERLLL